MSDCPLERFASRQKPRLCRRVEKWAGISETQALMAVRAFEAWWHEVTGEVLLLDSDDPCGHRKEGAR